jgi:hypothetical protein
LKLNKLTARPPALGNLNCSKLLLLKNILAVKLFSNSRLLAGVLLAAVLSTASGCARHNSLQKKTRWYKSHAGKTTPCPCGH